MDQRESSQCDGLLPSLGMGVGLRTVHYAYILKTRPKISWFEAISENYMGIRGGSGGRPIHTLEKIRKDYPIALHGVSLSIGSCDPLSFEYLKKLKRLTERIEPSWISDHLCWTGVGGENLHDLLPLPYTRKVADYVVERIQRVQDFLGRQILIENVSSYVSYVESEMPEWEFLTEVARRADCGILLDINNIFVSSYNHRFDPMDYLDFIPKDRVGQFHLAGHTDSGTHLIDTHDHPVRAEVWELYARAVARFGRVSTLLEWDDHIPEFPILENELNKARRIEDDVLRKRNKSALGSPRAPEVDALGCY